MYEPFQKFLLKAAASYNMTRQMEAAKICQEYRRVARSILPADAQVQTFPKSYDRKTLTVGVFDSAWAQQLAMQKHSILEAINRKYGADTVKNLKIEMSEKLSDAV